MTMFSADTQDPQQAFKMLLKTISIVKMAKCVGSIIMCVVLRTIIVETFIFYLRNNNIL